MLFGEHLRNYDFPECELIILFIFLTVNKIVLLYQEAIKLMDITKASVSNSDYLFVTDFRIPRNAKLFHILFRESGQDMYCTSSLKLRQSLHSTEPTYLIGQTLGIKAANYLWVKLVATDRFTLS